MTTDLLTLAEAQIAEKQYKEIQSVKERLEYNKETIVKAIELINIHTLLKQAIEEWQKYQKENYQEDYL